MTVMKCEIGLQSDQRGNEMIILVGIISSNLSAKAGAGNSQTSLRFKLRLKLIHQ